MKRIRALAEARLGDYNLDDAEDALRAIDDCTAAELPDDLRNEMSCRER